MVGKLETGSTPLMGAFTAVVTGINPEKLEESSRHTSDKMARKERRVG